jgi:CheY-like chemotaxis protein
MYCNESAAMAPLIAIFDNDDTVREVIGRLAHEEGWQVTGSRYTDAKFADVEESHPDLIVLDFDKFRRGGGWEFLQFLKLEESTADIPVIVMAVAFDLPREIKAHLASHGVIVIPKPVDLDQYMTVARRLIDGHNPSLLVPTERLPILLVEDNLSLASNFLEILDLEGYQVSTVPNGQMALEALQSGRYSLIFLDINMPVMNGMEFLGAYAMLPGPHTPVVIFSAHDPQAEGRLLPLFVIGRLPKDFAISELLAFVTQYVETA